MISPPPPIDAVVATVAISEVERALAGSNRRRRAILGRLADAAAAGSVKRASEVTRQYFGSPDAKLIAARRVLGPHATLQSIQDLAPLVDCYAPNREPIAWYPEPKQSGGYRTVCILPPRLKAVHHLIKDVLAAQFEPPEHIYDWKRRGRDRYTTDVLGALEQGFRWVYVGDVQDCFPSVNPDALSFLPLPRRVIRYALDYRQLRYIPINRMGDDTTCWTSYRDNHHASASGPCGLIQGSATSNLILAWLLRDLSKILGSDCRVFVYVDNIILATRDEASCRRIVQTLTSHLQRPCIGPLALKGHVQDAREGFEALGYAFWHNSLTGKWDVDFSGANTHKIFRRLSEALERDEEAGVLEPIELERAARQIITGFSAITDAADFVELQIEHGRDQLFPNEIRLRMEIHRRLGEQTSMSTGDLDMVVAMTRERERALLRHRGQGGR